MSPGRREPSFLPIAFRPFPRAFVPALRPLVAARARALSTMPTARATACRVQPYFLKMFYTRSLRGNFCSSRSMSSLILSRARSSSSTCLFAASLSALAFSSSNTRFFSASFFSRSAFSCSSSSRGLCSLMPSLLICLSMSLFSILRSLISTCNWSARCVLA